jgi:putative heme-binding domain-containing protein
LIGPLASIVGARRNGERIGGLLVTIAELKDVALQVDCLTGLLQGLKQGQPREFDSAQGRRGLSGLLNSSSEKLRGLALNVAGQLKVQDDPQVRDALAVVIASALDEKRSIASRVAALDLLAGAPYDHVLPIAEALLDVSQPLELQLAAVAALSSSDNPQIAATLLDDFAGYTPTVQEAVMQAVFARQNRLPKLLDALEQEIVATNVLSSIQQMQLKENSDPDVSRRAKALLSSKDRQSELGKVLAQYHKALANPASATRGELVFDDQCAKCHKLAGKGFEVGPDLSVISSKSNEMILSDILDPSSQISVGYGNFTVISMSGKICNGALSAETATSITLRKDQGVEDTILRKDIDEMYASSVSMMPEGLEKVVTPQDIADLTAFLRERLSSGTGENR